MSDSAFNGTAKVTMHLDGEAHTLEVDSKTSILDAALDAGLDPPYSCMAAACTTCMAKLNSGDVHMEEDDVLTEDERKEGYILCCQAMPRSAEVTITYE